MKNVDKITNPKLKKELSIIINSQKNDKCSKYQIKDWDGRPTNEEVNVDLSKFVLVVTTSTTNPQLPKEIQNQLKHIQPFLDKYFGLIFCFSTGVEVIIFLLTFKRKSKKKDKVDIQATRATRNRK